MTDEMRRICDCCGEELGIDEGNPCAKCAQLPEVQAETGRADAGEWQKRLLNSLVEAEYFSSLSASELFEALYERLEEKAGLEDSEIQTILCEIADRLGRLEELSGK